MKVLSRKPEILVLCGLPASGKSTYAKEWVNEDPENRSRINYDDLRLELFGENWAFNRQDEDKMKALAIERAGAALEVGKSLVIDNTNLTERARAPWIRLAKSTGVWYELHEIDTPVAECVRRDRDREARVGRAVIERFALFNGFIDWTLPEYDGEFVICDLDGTIADCRHRRKHIQTGWETGTECPCHVPVDGRCNSCGAVKRKKDWDAFFRDVPLDPPIEPIIRLLREYFQHYKLLFVSGRSMEKAAISTEDWLAKHLPDIPYLHLFMRGNSDHREDYIVKEEILELLPRDRIAYVLDDRDQVVQMWRRNGLTCLQVANGSF